MTKQIKRIATLIALIVYCMGLGSPLALAATATTSQSSSTANNGQALEIAPPVIYLSVNPGETTTTKIFIRDISSGDLIVTGQANDFIASGEDGTPKVLLNGDAQNNPYTLKSWVAPLPSLRLIPREIKTMTATLHVPSNASPGGHYGVIRFTATAPSVKGNGVSLSASLGVLVLATVSGKINENLSVQQFSVGHNGKTGSLFESGPLTFTEVLKNTGNVHEQPIGQVAVTDMFGHKIGAVNVNLPPGNVLPSSSRKFTQDLDKTVIGNKKLFGHYTAKLTITYGADKKVLTDSLSFWVIPFRLIFTIIIVLVAAFFILRYLLRRYNRRVLEQARKNQPPPTHPTHHQ